MKFVQRVSVISKGLLLAFLLSTALMGFSAASASAALMHGSPAQRSAIQQRSVSPMNYGNCDTGYYCLWNGTSATGLEYARPWETCTETYIYFTGVGSYANYSPYTVEVDYWNKNVDDYSLAFYILPGHTSSNTHGNPLAGRAAYVLVYGMC